jgi:elongation factor 1 alpha-like protein
MRGSEKTQDTNQSTPASNKKLAASLATKKKTAAGDKDATDGVKDLKIDDAPLPKSKNLDVLSEYEKSNSKKSASFVVVGTIYALHTIWTR